MKKLKVLVLCGGKSAEHLVSLVSAKTVLANIDPARYEPELVFIDNKGRWLKADAKRLTGKVEVRAQDVANGSKELVPTQKLSGLSRPDVVFPVLHGPLGEDGTVQGLFELAGVPYVGCGVLGSAVGMDKDVSKRLAQEAGLPILPWGALNAPAAAKGLAKSLGYPVFVKPARMGSSVGVSKVRNAGQLGRAVKLALSYDDKVILEKGIAAREIECAVLGDPFSTVADDPLAMRSSIVGEIMPNADFYDYKTKYLDPDRAKLKIPAELSEEETALVRELAEKAFATLDCYGMARVDFLMDKKTGELWFNEVNTIPGFTAASMYPMLWRESGLPTPELIDLLIRLAVRRQKARSRLKTTP
ncbi:MAG: D-alanine--D-alanine ligase [Elusimicrobia bacterium]|nr:D-alanine--D-alanine ligase [Elusimicrobiota bacterium]